MVPVRNRAGRGALAIAIAPFGRGGRAAGLAALARIRPGAYARSRNFLDGAVSRLSPYLRHGMLSLAEVRDAALRVRSRPEVDTFVRELAWRDYYVRVRAALGDTVWNDLEAYKTGEPATAYAENVPDDVAAGATGAACIDGFVRDLVDTGYVHNHARMWFASYVVHHRRTRWQAGASFYLRHLLDGDPASNNLSWQWVASTFSHKPYFFNRANLERYTRGTYCATCPLARAGCPFEAPYDALAARLFPNGQRAVETVVTPDLRVPADAAPPAPDVTDGAIVWQHEESLSRDDPARTLARGDAVFVWDDEARARDPWSDARTAFVREALDELDLAAIVAGDAIEEVGRFARARGATTIVAVTPVDPRLRDVAAGLARSFDVVLVPPEPFARLDRSVDLRRFSRYWARAERSAFPHVRPLELGIETG